jgi:hypothetical protein
MASNVSFRKVFCLLVLGFGPETLVAPELRPKFDNANSARHKSSTSSRLYNNKVRLVAKFDGWKRSVRKLLSVTKLHRAL